MGVLTFEQLPEAVSLLSEKITSLESLLRRILSEKNEPNDEKLLSVKEAADYLKLSIPTIYYLSSKKLLPVLKPGKNLYFNKSDLDKYLQDSRRASAAEIQQSIRA